MTRADLVEFLRGHTYAVQASVSASNAPQAAVVGVVVTDELELFFDTFEDSRKCANLRRDNRVAFVFWNGERTIQYEGVADEPVGEELAALKARYFETFPDGRERETWPGITYFRVRAQWLRYADYGTSDPRIVEFTPRDLQG